MAGRSLAGLAEPVHPADTTEHAGHHIAQLAGLPDPVVCVSLQRLRPDGTGIRSKLWPLPVRGSGPELRFPAPAAVQRPLGHQPGGSAGRGRVRAQLCRAGDGGPGAALAATAATGAAAATAAAASGSGSEQDDVGKRHAWISAGEQRAAALTQL